MRKPHSNWQVAVRRLSGKALLIAVDLDGSLLRDDRTLSARSISAIDRARGHGIPIIPVTSRPLHDVYDLLAGTTVGPLAITSNGARICDLRNGQVLWQAVLTSEMTGEILNESRRRVPGMATAWEYGNGLYYEAPLTWALELDIRRDRRYHTENSGVLPPPTVAGKLILWHPEVPAAELAGIIEACVEIPISVVITGNDRTQWVEILHPNAGKGAALGLVADYLHTRKTLAIGDGLNDLSLAEAADFFFAMENAPAEVKEKAFAVLPANNQDGVAQFLEECCLNPSLERILPSLRLPPV